MAAALPITPEPVCVDSSVPQGDPWSMLAMSTALTAPLLDLQSRFARAGFALYVDDRSFVATSAFECLAIAQAWRTWSDALGLAENLGKDQYHHRTVAGRRQLVNAGCPEDKVLESPKILGCMLKPATGRRSTSVESERLRTATWTLNKIRCLPVRLATKVLLCGMSAISKATYGWVCRLPTLRECRSLEWKLARACRVARHSDPNLRRILLGHNTSLLYRTAASQVAACFDRASRGLQMPDWSGAWARAVKKAMLRLGFDSGPSEWSWRQGRSRVVLDSSIGLSPVTKSALAHVLREAWRRHLFDTWQVRARKDSRLCRGASYRADKCKLARLAALRDRNTFAVLSGAAWSPARRHANDGGDMTCPWCGARFGTWDHLAWRCPAHVHSVTRPRTWLEARLGWGHAVALDHLCRTRIRLLSEAGAEAS